jgi:hypothetical protein
MISHVKNLSLVSAGADKRTLAKTSELLKDQECYLKTLGPSSKCEVPACMFLLPNARIQLTFDRKQKWKI